MDITIRPARDTDRKMIFEWRNTPFLVKLGSSGKEVTWEEHCRWFDSVLKDRDTELYIIYSDNTPAGQIRFEKQEAKTYIVTIYLTEQYTGRSIGVTSLKKGIEGMLNKDPELSFIAFIKDENVISIKAFSRAGFTKVEGNEETPSGHVMMYYKPGMKD